MYLIRAPSNAGVGVECWGRDSDGQSTPPDGTFTSVSAGGHHTCGVLDTGAVECWGSDGYGLSTPPDGTFTSVSAGWYYACGVLDTGAVECWGNDRFGKSTPPGGTFTSVSAGALHTCGVLDTGAVECWGLDESGQSTPPAGTFTSVSAGEHHTCGVLATGAVECWGLDGDGQSTPPAGTFTSVSAGNFHTCGVLATGAVECWGWDEDGQSTPPAGTFTSVSARGHTCGVLATGAVECWGRDGYGQSTPPGSDGGGSSPDLIVASPSVSDNSPSAGQSFTLQATVRNQGTGSSAATTLRYYQSSDATISTADTRVGTDTVGGLDAAGTSSESITLTAPSNAGTYYYGACVESVSGENNTGNNCSSGVRVTVSSGGGGDTFTTAEALPGVPTSGLFIPAIVSGASVSASGGGTTVTFNNGGYIELQNGTRYTCQAAGGCQVLNGVVTRGTIVSGATAAGAPDLVVQSPSVSDSSPDAGATFTLSATVRNRGDGRSAATTLRYYRSSDATISASDTRVGTDAVGALAAGRTSSESVSLTAPSSAGTYYYGACVDTVSGESDTRNNCSSAVRLTVSSGGGGTTRAGECVEGNTYGPGEGCDVYGTGGSSSNQRFSVLSDGRARFGFSTAGNSISNRGGSINGVQYHFVASHQGGGMWEVDEYRPGSGDSGGGGGVDPGGSDAPSGPQNITVTREGSNVRVSWDASPGATHYEVWRCDTRSGPLECADGIFFDRSNWTNLARSLTATSYVDRNPPTSTSIIPFEIYYSVQSCNQAGCSGSL